MKNTKKLIYFYKKYINFSNVFKEIGDSMDIYIESDKFKLENVKDLKDSLKICGQRPYSSDSDILAISLHMGILFQKNKQSNQEYFSVVTNALKFGKGVAKPEAEQKKDIKFTGVVVTITTTSPLELYKSMQGHGIVSQESRVSGKFALDVIGYSHKSLYEPINSDILTDDLNAAIYRLSDRADFRFNIDTGEVTSTYNPDQLKKILNKYLLECSCLRLYGEPDSGSVYEFGKDTQTGLLFVKHNDEKTDFSFEELAFEENGFKIRDKLTEKITRFSISNIRGRSD